MTTPRQALTTRTLDHFLGAGDPDESLRSTAAALGVSHSLLLYHFGGRDQLLLAVQAACEERFRATLADLDTGGAPDVARAMWRHLADPRHWPLYRLGFLLRARRGPDRAESAEREHWLAALAPIVAASGVADDDVPDVAMLWLATARGLLWELVCGADPGAVDRAAEQLFVRFV